MFRIRDGIFNLHYVFLGIIPTQYIIIYIKVAVLFFYIRDVKFLHSCTRFRLTNVKSSTNVKFYDQNLKTSSKIKRKLCFWLKYCKIFAPAALQTAGFPQYHCFSIKSDEIAAKRWKILHSCKSNTKALQGTSKIKMCRLRECLCQVWEGECILPYQIIRRHDGFDSNSTADGNHLILIGEH